MGKAGNAGQETSKQGCERNDGGEPGDGARLEITFAVLVRRERESVKKTKKKKKGQTSWYQKEKEKEKDLKLNILRSPSLY